MSAMRPLIPMTAAAAQLRRTAAGSAKTAGELVSSPRISARKIPYAKIQKYICHLAQEHKREQLSMAAVA
jgi:hypothetical protein